MICQEARNVVTLPGCRHLRINHPRIAIKQVLRAPIFAPRTEYRFERSNLATVLTNHLLITRILLPGKDVLAFVAKDIVRLAANTLVEILGRNSRQIGTAEAAEVHRIGRGGPGTAKHIRISYL